MHGLITARILSVEDENNLVGLELPDGKVFYVTNGNGKIVKQHMIDSVQSVNLETIQPEFEVIALPRFDIEPGADKYGAGQFFGLITEIVDNPSLDSQMVILETGYGSIYAVFFYKAARSLKKRDFIKIKPNQIYLTNLTNSHGGMVYNG